MAEALDKSDRVDVMTDRDISAHLLGPPSSVQVKHNACHFQRDGPTGPPLDGHHHEHDDGRSDVLQHHHLLYCRRCSNDDRTSEVRKLLKVLVEKTSLFGNFF